MQCFGDVFEKNIDVDVFDDVLQNAKRRAYDASNDVNRPPLCYQDPRSGCVTSNIKTSQWYKDLRLNNSFFWEHSFSSISFVNGVWQTHLWLTHKVLKCIHRKPGIIQWKRSWQINGPIEANRGIWYTKLWLTTSIRHCTSLSEGGQQCKSNY